MQMEQPDAEVIAMPGLRTRMAAYQHNTTHKKKHGATSGRDKKKRVGKLKEELRDPGQFESPAAAMKPAKPIFQVATDVEMEQAQTSQQEPGSLQSNEHHLSTSPLRRKNPSALAADNHHALEQLDAPEGFRSTLTRADYDLHPGDKSFDSEDDCAKAMCAAISRNHGNHEREMVAKTRLNVLLQREMKDAKVAHNYAACRVRYLRAVGNLRPTDYYGDDLNDSFSMESMGLPSPDVRARRRQKRKTEKEKKGRYDELKETWHSYDDVALDKPMEPTPEERELENDLDEIEEEIHEEWEDFTQDVLQSVEEEKEAGIEEEDPDIEEWRQEQKKLKEDALNRKKRKVEREKKRQAYMEVKRREQEAHRKEYLDKQEKEKQAGSALAEVVLDKQNDPKAEISEQKPADEPEHDHDADNEQEGSPHTKERKKGKHKKKKHTKHEKHGEEPKTDAVASSTPAETPEPQKPLVEATGTTQPADGAKPNMSNEHPVPEEDHDSESSVEETDTSQTGDSLAMRTDAAWKKRGKSGALGQLKFLGQEDEEEEEDILGNMPNIDPSNLDAAKEEANERDRKPRRPMREKSMDAIELPPNLPNSQGQTPLQKIQSLAQQPRKKKELRIEYDNGIPKEITLIINKRADSGDGCDDESYSSVSGSESESESSSSSESSQSVEELLPAKRNGVKKNEPFKKTETSPRKPKNKLDVLRIDTLPAQQFYDGTEESPFIAWTHRPLKSKVDGSQIVVKVPPRTDCWRKTRHNFIMDNAPFYWHRVTGDFEVMVKVSGDMKKMYDKAGIMIRLDAENWICSGLEFFNNELNHMTCVTRDYTDWSMAPVAPEAKSQGAWICIKRIGNAYESFCSLDGRNWRQARQGIFTDAKSVRVGVFCACPMGESYKVAFDKYRCKNLNI